MKHLQETSELFYTGAKWNGQEWNLPPHLKQTDKQLSFIYFHPHFCRGTCQNTLDILHSWKDGQIHHCQLNQWRHAVIVRVKGIRLDVIHDDCQQCLSWSHISSLFCCCFLSVPFIISTNCHRSQMLRLPWRDIIAVKGFSMWFMHGGNKLLNILLSVWIHSKVPYFSYNSMCFSMYKY